MIFRQKHRDIRATYRARADFGRVALLLLLFAGSWGGLVGCVGRGDAGRSDSRTPFVSTDSSNPSPRQQRETLYAYGEVNVRSGPGSTHAVAGTLARGDRIEVGEADARGWSPAYDDHGQRIGYVYRASTNLRPYEPAAPSGSAPRAVRGSPGGATAICRDGTRSYSAHRSGACSRHGGVARWL